MVGNTRHEKARTQDECLNTSGGGRRHRWEMVDEWGENTEVCCDFDDHWQWIQMFKKPRCRWTTMQAHALTHPWASYQTNITGMCEETGETRYKMKPRLNCLLVCDVVSWGCCCECVGCRLERGGFLATSQTQLWQTHLSNTAVGFFCKCASAR